MTDRSPTLRASCGACQDGLHAACGGYRGPLETYLCGCYERHAEADPGMHPNTYEGRQWAIAEEMAAAAGVPLHLLPPPAATSAVAFRASAAGQAEARLARALDEKLDRKDDVSDAGAIVSEFVQMALDDDPVSRETNMTAAASLMSEDERSRARQAAHSMLAYLT